MLTLRTLHIAALTLTSSLTQALPTPVTTTAGAVQGAPSRLPLVWVYKGLPYATAQRFAAPLAPTPWQGVRAADRFGAACPQPASKFDPSEPQPLLPELMSEDCLYLNVWRPLDAAPDARLPVLVWIHGGAFTFGSGALPAYDGAALAARGLVVVTLNYRIGQLGYLAHPALSAAGSSKTSGNYALLDQIAALRWLQANLPSFGGDATQVTIAGHSGGGVSVSSLMVAPGARGLFARAIVQSGPISGLAPTMRDLPQAEALGAAFMQERGAQTLAELHALPVAEMLKRRPGDQGVTGPIVEGANLPRVPADVFVNGEQAPVPLMIGVTSAESGSMGPVPATPETFQRFVGWLYADDKDKVLATYPHATPEQASDSQADIKRDQMLAASVAYVACHLRIGQPVYNYVYDHAPPGPNAAQQRAYHGSELGYVLDNLDAIPRDWTAQDRQLARELSGYWVNFIKTGNPNGAGLKPWPLATPGSLGVRLNLGVNEGSEPSMQRLENFFSGLDPRVQAYGAPPSTTGCKSP